MEDTLTGLHDRKTFLSLLRQQVGMAVARQVAVGLLVVDIEDFTRHNNVLGYDRGDLILVGFARVLESVARSFDHVARIGDDRFALILPSLQNVGQAELAVHKLHRLLEVPLELGDAKARVYTTAGLAVCPQHGQQYQSVVYLNEKSISSSIENYFEQSAQSRTYFRVFTERKNDKISCGAIMLQVMGESSDAQQTSEEEMKDHWHRLKLILNTIQPEEVVPGKYLPESVLMRLFAEDVVRVFDTAPLTFSVTDTRERMGKALKSVGAETCKELLKEGPITMTCEFSGKEEVFTEKDLEKLFKDEWS